MVSKVNVPGILTVTFWVVLGATTMRLLISALMAMTFCLPSKKGWGREVFGPGFGMAFYSYAEF